VKAKVFRKKADAGARRAVAKRRAQQPPGARRRLGQRQQHFDRGGLAGAVWAEEPEDLAGTHVQRQIGHRDGCAELLAQRVGLDHSRLTSEVRHQRTELAIANDCS
jgi:hypothetical protein